MSELSASQPRSEEKRVYLAFGGLYTFSFYAFGALTPLLTQYYQAIHLTGTQIGTISSVTPLVSIFVQPLWGMVCDKFHIRKPILLVALLAAAVVSLFFTMISAYAWIIVLFTVFSLFQCAIVPISDTLALNFVQKTSIPYGNIRLWGAIGYAVAVYLTGLGVKAWGANAIFYFHAIACVVAVLFLRGIPDDGGRTQIGGNLFIGLGQLLRLPRFLLFLISSFFVFGTINAHNTWFALFYQHIGGTIVGVGFAFLLFAGSEAPFMRIAGYITKRWGLEMTLIIAVLVSSVQWFLYGSSPTTTVVIATFFIQGISVGFYLTAAAQFVRENTPSALQVTAMAVFASFSQGLGTMFCNMLAGVIMEHMGILSTYNFFGIATIVGLLPLLYIRFATKPAVLP